MIAFDMRIGDWLKEEGVKGFPDECCGFLLGTEDPEGTRTITDILRVQNAKEGDRRRRFEISTTDYLRAERFAMDKDKLLLGVYHSHPNHPPIPSEHDRQAAQPYFSYLILSVINGVPDGFRSWRLDESGQFEEEKIREYELR
jgi:proteasome lid subunit RPN8/RPN11